MLTNTGPFFQARKYVQAPGSIRKAQDLRKGDFWGLKGLMQGIKKFEIMETVGYAENKADVMNNHPAVGSTRVSPSLGVSESSALH
jgi:hypothetical protein